MRVLCLCFGMRRATTRPPLDWLKIQHVLINSFLVLREKIERHRFNPFTDLDQRLGPPLAAPLEEAPSAVHIFVFLELRHLFMSVFVRTARIRDDSLLDFLIVSTQAIDEPLSYRSVVQRVDNVENFPTFE